MGAGREGDGDTDSHTYRYLRESWGGGVAWGCGCQVRVPFGEVVCGVRGAGGSRHLIQRPSVRWADRGRHAFRAAHAERVRDGGRYGESCFLLSEWHRDNAAQQEMNETMRIFIHRGLTAEPEAQPPSLFIYR